MHFYFYCHYWRVERQEGKVDNDDDWFDPALAKEKAWNISISSVSIWMVQSQTFVCRIMMEINFVTVSHCIAITFIIIFIITIMTMIITIIRCVPSYAFPCMDPMHNSTKLPVAREANFTWPLNIIWLVLYLARVVEFNGAFTSGIGELESKIGMIDSIYIVK